MKKPFLILVVLLLVSMVSMVWVNPVGGNPATELSVNPLSIMDDTKQPKPVQTIRPMADSAYSTFTDWTNNTLTVRPNAEGTYSDWAGRILTLKPNDHGTYSEWSSWVHISPSGEGNFTGWTGSYSGWNEWPTIDPTGEYYQYASAHNLNDTSELANPPTTPRALPISKVRLTIVARDYPSDIDEQVQMMLSTVILANVSSFTEASDWAGWQRVPPGTTGPWLNRADYVLNVGNYINTTSAAKIGNFTFQTVPAGITWGGVSPVQLRLKTWQSGGDGGDYLKIYLYDGTSWNPTPYTVTPSTIVGSYRDVDVSVFLNSVAKINAAKMAIEKVTVSTADNIYVDYASIRLSGVRNPSSYGVTTPLTITYASYKSEWATNPFTGSAWTWSDIDLLQAGVRSVMVGSWTASTYLRVTQLYVSVLTGGLYTDWDEWPDPTQEIGASTDYILAAADAKRQSSALPDTVSPPFPTIAKVRVSIVARVNETTDEEVQMMVGIPPFDVTANVDGFDNTLTGWTRVPPGTTGPWLATSDYPTNYIYTTGNGIQIGAFSFQNASSGTTWSAVKLRIKTWQSAGGNDQLTIELYDGTSWSTVTVTPFTPPTTAGYSEFDVSSFLNTATKVNATKIRLTKDSVQSADTVYVDHAYLSLSRAYYGSPTTLSTSYLTYSSEWATSPATGLAWTWSDIDALQAGVKSKVGTVDPPTWTGEIRVTQLYVKVIEAGTYQHWDDIPAESNVDGKTTVTDWDSWTKTGASPYLAAADYPTNYINSTTDGDRIGNFTFADVPLGLTWGTATLRLKTWKSDDVGGSDQLKIYLYNGVSYTSYTITPTTTGAPGSYVNIDVSSFLDTSAKINAAKMALEHVVFGTADTIGVDHAYISFPAPDGDGTYNSAVSSGLSRSSQLQDHTSETWSIARVQVSVVARTDISTDEKLNITLVIGGTRYNSSSFTPTTAYRTYSYVWTTNPAVGSWSWATIDALQAGVSSVQTGTAWKGEIRVTQLYVVVCRAGTYAQWDEATQNGDTDYVSATMKNMRESSQLQNPTHQTWDIARVRVVFYARVTETTDEKVQPMLVIGGSVWVGSDAEKYTLTTNYVKYTGDWGKNPDTKDYWTWNDIDALEAGVTSLVSDDELWTGEIRVTQLYVEVAGPRFMVYVQVADVTNLYSYEFFLNYTTDVFTAASISLGGWFPYNSVIWINEINDTAGYAHYSVSMPFGPSPGLTGSGKLANITFFPDSYGESPLDLWNTKLRNSAAQPIAHNVNDGYFNNMILGDITRDQTVNTPDLSGFSQVYGSEPTTSNWNQGDFNRDNKTDAYDLFDLGKNYGKSISP